MSRGKASACLCFLCLLTLRPQASESTAAPANRSVARLLRSSSGGYSQWRTGGFATFYGGPDASGTWGGACGYGDLRPIPRLGTSIAAAADSFWADGTACGACYQLQCVSSPYCRRHASMRVTITDRCPTCLPGRMHFDLSQPGFERLANDLVAGIVSVRYRRVPCFGYSRIAIIPMGNAWWMSVLVRNVAGPGDIAMVEVKRSTDHSWLRMTRDWGSNFIFNPDGRMSTLSFRITSKLKGRVAVLSNCLPPNFVQGNVYNCNGQFRV